MNVQHLFLVAALGVASAGCSNIERSRDLSNPAISAVTLAQQVCSNCHGVDGNSISPQFPRLSGQQATYLKSQLTNFRSHQRSDPAGSTYMWGLSRYLSDEQIAGLADYYAKQPVTKSAAVASTPLIEAGKDIYDKGVPDQAVIACSACHGPKAQGIDAFPRLANQHADYLIKQLNIFQNTQGRPGTPMEAVTHPLTGGDKDAVAAYLQSFQD